MHNPEQLTAISQMTDREILQSALDAMAAGYAVTIPRRDFYVDGPLYVADHDGFEIFGNLCHIHQTLPNQKTLVFKNCHNGSVRGFMLTGVGTELNGASSSFNGVSGIYLEDCRDIEVHHNYLFNHVGGGIRWSGSSTSISVSHNRVWGIGSGGGILPGDNSNDVAIGSIATVYNNDIQISNNKIEGHCFGISVTRGDGITITNNNIRDIPGQHGIYLQEVSDAIISGNIFKDTAFVAIKTQVAKVDTTLEDTLITDNVIYDVGQTGISVNTTTEAGNNSGFDGVTISNNKIRRAGFYGIQVKKAAASTIRGNEVRSIGAYGILVQLYIGKVALNDVCTTGWSGIYAECAGSASLIGNDIYDAVQNPANEPASSRTKYAIVIIKSSTVLENSVNVFVKDNTVRSTLPDGIHYTSCMSIKTGIHAKLVDSIDATNKPPIADGGVMEVIRSYSA